MADRLDKDHLVKGPLPPNAPTAKVAGTSVVPTQDPNPRSLTEQRADLQQSLDEAEGALRYMGTGHPLRKPTEEKVKQLRMLLAGLEKALKPPNPRQ